MARILLVDDEKSIHAFLKYVLTKRGHQVDGTLSGVLALERVQEKEFDLFLIDLDMPEMNGDDLVLHLRARGKSSPVIILSGLPDEEVRLTAERLQAAGHLRKPFKVERLVTEIDRVLGQS
ncbi:MAG: response regulator [Planctomycetes bacterium]|jgi:DNA-binding response OmpR family regulator|nr:response regulator [Planctomycetota bacterium]